MNWLPGRDGAHAPAGDRDVAIYSPASSFFYEDLSQGAEAGPMGGGAELQMTLLAAGLESEGLRVAHIVWPVELRRPLPDPAPSLVERPAHRGTGALARGAEARDIWRALGRARARAYIFRGGGPQLLVAAAFCRARSRKLVFSSAIDLDFDFERSDRDRMHLLAHRAGARRADLVVVQSRRQVELAREAGLGPVELIPSFAEPAGDASEAPEAFLWIGRLVEYKRPLEFLELARAVPEARFRMVYFELPETPGDEALAARLHAEAAAIDNLELLGQQPRARTLELIERAFAIVSTSRSEGMPNVFLEAWARGVPVVSLDYDPDGQIASRQLGIVAGGSPTRLADAVRALSSTASRRRELGANGRDYVREVHGVDNVSRIWARTLRGLIAKGGPPR